MHKPDTWTLLERLSDPATPDGEKHALESQLKADRRLQEHLETFRILQQWPNLEKASQLAGDPQAVFARLEHEWELEAVDREIGRAFPFVAAAALAAAVVLGILNLGAMRDLSSGTLDALFALPQPTLEDTFLAEL